MHFLIDLYNWVYDLVTNRLTSARAGYLDRLDAAVTTRAAASGALSDAVWTNVKAGYLDMAISAVPSGIVGVQTGYVSSGSPSSGATEDTQYIDTTITAVANVNKCLVIVQVAAGSSSSNFTARLTSTTNVRVSCASASATMRARFYVVEFQ